MKFLVDAQLPKSLSDFLNHRGYDSIHTIDLPNKNRTKDSQIAKLANEEGRIVISKDIDFLESFLLKSEPQKLIIVKTGNIVNRELIKIFEENFLTIIHLISRSKLIEIGKNDIIEHE